MLSPEEKEGHCTEKLDRNKSELRSVCRKSFSCPEYIEVKYIPEDILLFVWRLAFLL